MKAQYFVAMDFDGTVTDIDHRCYPGEICKAGMEGSGNIVGTGNHRVPRMP